MTSEEVGEKTLGVGCNCVQSSAEDFGCQLTLAVVAEAATSVAVYRRLVPAVEARCLYELVEVEAAEMEAHRHSPWESSGG